MSKGLGFGAALALLAGMLLINLEHFPGLHGDEAFTGLTALKIAKNGVESPSFLNSYTSPILSYLISLVFNGFGVSVKTLRMTGVVLNLAAVGILLGFVLRRGGLRAGLVYVLLLFSSLIFLIDARLAWEVAALNPLCLAIVMVSTDHLLKETRFRGMWYLAFLYACYFATVSHFYFLLVFLALAISASLLERENESSKSFLAQLSISSLMLLSVFVTKKFLSAELWMAHRAVGSLVFLFFPLPFFVLWSACAPVLNHAVRSALRALLPPKYPLPLRIFGWLFLLCLIIRSFFHWIALGYVSSNLALVNRVYSSPPALWLSMMGVVTVFGLLMGSLWAIKEASRQNDRWMKLWLLFVPLFISVLAIIRNDTSIRYYLVPLFALFAVISLSMGQGNRIATAFVVWLLLSSAAFQFVHWSNVLYPQPRCPYRFRMGSYREVTSGFMPLEASVKELRLLKACPGRTTNYFIYNGIEFYRSMTPWSCEHYVHMDYSYDCAKRPPYIQFR